MVDDKDFVDVTTSNYFLKENTIIYNKNEVEVDLFKDYAEGTND